MGRNSKIHVGSKLAHFRAYVGSKLAHFRAYVRSKLAHFRAYVGSKLAHFRAYVGSKLGYNIDGEMRQRRTLVSLGIHHGRHSRHSRVLQHIIRESNEGSASYRIWIRECFGCGRWDPAPKAGSKIHLESRCCAILIYTTALIYTMYITCD